MTLSHRTRFGSVYSNGRFINQQRIFPSQVSYPLNRQPAVVQRRRFLSQVRRAGRAYRVRAASRRYVSRLRHIRGQYVPHIWRRVASYL